MRKPCTAGSTWEPMETLESRQLLAAISWDGGGGDLSWHNPLNWSGDVLPGPGDDVTIEIPGFATIEHTQNVTTEVRSVTSRERLRVSDGLLTTETVLRSQALSLEGGEIGGHGHVHVNQIHWSGGTISGAGRIQVVFLAQLTITGDVVLARDLVNNGEVTWESGDIDMRGAQILNLPERTFQLRSPGSILPSGPEQSSFINLGRLTRDGTPESTSTVGVPFDNRSAFIVGFPTLWPEPTITDGVGFVEAYRGTLEFTGAVLQKVGSILQNGHWHVTSAEGRLLLPGPSITAVQNVGGRQSSILLRGQGSRFPQIATAAIVPHLTLEDRAFPISVPMTFGYLVVDSQGTMTIPVQSSGNVVNLLGGRLIVGTFHAHHVHVEQGTEFVIAGVMGLGHMPSPAVQFGDFIEGGGVLRITGVLQSASIVATSTIIVGPTGRIEPHPFLGFAPTFLGRLINHGEITISTPADWRFSPEIVNRGTITISASMSFYSDYGLGSAPQPAFFHNFGTINVLNGSLVTFRGSNGGARFNNHGTVNVSGTLRVFGGGQGGGQWTVAQGSEIAFGGLDVSLRHATISGGGLIRIGANMRFESGGISGAGDMFIGPSGRLTLLNPQPNTPGQNNLIVRTVTTNNGRIDVEDAAEIRGALRNSGTLAIGGTLATDRFVPSASSVLRIRSTADQQNAVLSVVHGGFFQGTVALDFLWQPTVGHVFTMYQTTILNAPGEPFDAFDQVVATGLLPGRGVEFFVVSGQQTTAAGRVRIT